MPEESYSISPLTITRRSDLFTLGNVVFQDPGFVAHRGPLGTPTRVGTAADRDPHTHGFQDLAEAVAWVRANPRRPNLQLFAFQHGVYGPVLLQTARFKVIGKIAHSKIQNHANFCEPWEGRDLLVVDDTNHVCGILSQGTSKWLVRVYNHRTFETMRATRKGHDTAATLLVQTCVEMFHGGISAHEMMQLRAEGQAFLARSQQFFATLGAQQALFFQGTPPA